MKKIIFFTVMMLFIASSVSFAELLAFSSEDLSGKGSSSTSAPKSSSSPTPTGSTPTGKSYKYEDYMSGVNQFNNRSTKTSGDGGYNYDDYMGTSPPADNTANRNRSARSRELMPYHFEFEVNINPNVVEGRLGAFLPMNLNSLGAAVGVLYDKDNFTIGNADVTFGNRQGNDPFVFDIGLRGIVGSAEKPESTYNGDFKALGLLVSVIYNLQGAEIFYQMPINFEIAGEMSFAPNPVCFGDGEQYMEAKLSLGIDLFGDGRGFLILGGRYVDMRLSKYSEDWEASGGSVFAGFKLRF